MHYAVPRGNREYGAWPPVEKLPALVRSNVKLKASHSLQVLGLPVAEFRGLCRKDTARVVAAYADVVGASLRDLADGPIVATGHQPELYHCGVWIKNHLAARVAQAAGCASLNLIVDNDVPKHPGIVLPERYEGSWRMGEAAFAEGKPERAFEEHPPTVVEADSLRAAVARIATGTPAEDNAVELAARLIAAAGTGGSLSDVTTAVRLSYEREVDLANAEAPASLLSDTASFGAFVTSIICEASGFAAIYNEALSHYRRENHIRSKANPLPDLAHDGELIEAPFWIWHAGGRRERLFVRVEGALVRLYEDGFERGTLDSSSFEAAAASWATLVDNGVKVRPKALSNTIFMRMFVADLFIHGIGGAKYDEVTDRIIRRFYSVEPPPHATVSATLMIDWGREKTDPALLPALKNEIRDIGCNPQRHFPPGRITGQVETLVDEKWRLVASPGRTSAEKRRAWLRIREINANLAAGLVDVSARKERKLEETRRAVEEDKVLFGREYASFVVGAARAARFFDEALAALKTPQSD